MEHIVTSPAGQKFKVNAPEGASDDEILSYVQQHPEAKPDKTFMDTSMDMSRGFATGLRQGAEGVVGLPGGVESGINSAFNAASGKDIGLPQHLPTKEDIAKLTKQAIGDYYQPQTEAGNLGRSAGESVVGSMAGPGRALSNLGMGVASGIGSELAGQQFSGSPYEPLARAGGGLAGGVTSMLGSRGLEAARNAVSAKSAGGAIGDILGTGPVKAGAVNRVAKSMEDDRVSLSGALQRQDDLGKNEAMVMDLGRQLQGRAEQMALHSGAAQNKVLDAVEGRTGQYGSGASERVRDTLDQHLGPSQNIVDVLDRVDEVVRKHAEPAYQHVMGKYLTLPVPAEITERPAVAHAMQQAGTIAKNYGENLGDTPGLKYWDYVKKGLDQRINGMMRSGMDDLSSAQKADLGGLISAKKSLVEHLDTVTNGEYANARSIAATKPELHDAMDFGRSIFNSKLLPEEVRAHISDLSMPAQAMAQAGARRELERTLDSVRNDGAKARAFLDTNNNLAKISDLFGPQAAQAIENRVAAENHFQSATESIARNSRTAGRQELAKDTANPSLGDYHTTLTGIATAPIKSGLAYAIEHGMANTRSGISDILTAKGAKMSPIVQELLNYNAAKASHAGAPLSSQAKALVRALISNQAGQ